MQIQIEHLTKRIKGVTVLDDITYSFQGGCIYGLSGKNGCGKTMLMRSIAGLIYPTSGSVIIDGEVLGKDRSFPKSMGLLIENPMFLRDYTGFENLRLLAKIQGGISDDAIWEVLEQVGLLPDDRRKYYKYSLGMRQRLGIAAAIMGEPDYHYCMSRQGRDGLYGRYRNLYVRGTHQGRGKYMKWLRFLNYDIEEGLLRFWKRYLLVILAEVVVCAFFQNSMEYFTKMYQEGLSPLEYGINALWGRYPYHYDPTILDSFRVPFSWIMEYLLLAYCIGGYVTEDMQGMGIQLMTKSGQRVIWWLSKCIWCIVVNLVYFGLIWGVNLTFSWILIGDVRTMKHEMLLESYYGMEVAQTSVAQLLCMTLLLPVLVGTAQSLFQIIVSIRIGSIPSLVIISGILVVSTYYSNRFLVHGYAMVSRYFTESMYKDYVPLQVSFGIIYLAVCIFILMGVY